MPIVCVYLKWQRLFSNCKILVQFLDVSVFNWQLPLNIIKKNTSPSVDAILSLTLISTVGDRAEPARLTASHP